MEDLILSQRKKSAMVKGRDYCCFQCLLQDSI